MPRQRELRGYFSTLEPSLEVIASGNRLLPAAATNRTAAPPPPRRTGAARNARDGLRVQLNRTQGQGHSAAGPAVDVAQDAAQDAAHAYDDDHAIPPSPHHQWGAGGWRAALEVPGSMSYEDDLSRPTTEVVVVELDEGSSPQTVLAVPHYMELPNGQGYGGIRVSLPLGNGQPFMPARCNLI